MSERTEVADADGGGGGLWLDAARRRPARAGARGTSRPTTSGGCGSTRRPITAACTIGAMTPGAAAGGDAAAAQRSVARRPTSRRRRSSASRTCSTTSSGSARRSGATRGRDPGMYYVRVFGDARPGRDVGLALRRPPRLGEPHDRRRRARRVDAVLPRRRPGRSRRCSARTCCGRSAGAEDLGRELVRSLDAGAARPRPARARRAGRPRHGQPPARLARRPAAAAAGDLPRPPRPRARTSGWPPARRRWRRRSA